MHDVQYAWQLSHFLQKAVDSSMTAENLRLASPPLLTLRPCICESPLIEKDITSTANMKSNGNRVNIAERLIRISVDPTTWY